MLFRSAINCVCWRGDSRIPIRDIGLGGFPTFLHHNQTPRLPEVPAASPSSLIEQTPPPRWQIGGNLFYSGCNQPRTGCEPLAS